MTKDITSYGGRFLATAAVTMVYWFLLREMFAYIGGMAPDPWVTVTAIVMATLGGVAMVVIIALIWILVEA